MRDRCDALAAAIRALGVRHPIGEVRAEVAGRLLDGSMAGLDGFSLIVGVGPLRPRRTA